MVFSDLGPESFEIDNMQDPEAFKLELAGERDQVALARRELSRKIQQSQIEVNKLARRNASITQQIQQLQLETTSREDIRTVFVSALDAQQRLFVMRGQLEKLQGEEVALEKYYKLLDKVLTVTDQEKVSQPGSASSFATVETIIRAQEDERLRLSQQMHDGPAQALTNFILQTDIATRLFDVDQNRAREELGMLKTSATKTFQKVRDFIFELRPMMLDDLGLAPTLRRYVDAIKEHANLEMEVLVTGQERRMESYLEVVIFRSFQELVRNAISHSQATELKIQLDMTDFEAKLIVEDNGKGLDSSRILEDEKKVGLRVIQERAEMLGGKFELDSSSGQGTRVTLRIPVSRAPEIR